MIPCGSAKTCLPDAAYNGLVVMGFSGASLARLRTLSVPKLGVDPMASWRSVGDAFFTLQYPFELREATASVRHAGGPMLNLFKMENKVYLVALEVKVDGFTNRHCVVLSTFDEEKDGKKFIGKLIDNHRGVKPVYLEEKDRRGKQAAKAAWRTFVGQNPALRDKTFNLNPMDVYELEHVS